MSFKLLAALPETGVSAVHTHFYRMAKLLPHFSA